MLRGSAVLLSGGLAGAVAAHELSGTASGAETELTIAGDDVTVREESIAAVALELGVGWAYSVPSGESPARVAVSIRAGIDADDLQRVATHDAEVRFLEADGEFTASVDLVAEGVLDGDTLVPEAGGETATREVTVAVELRVYDESDLVIAADSQTDSATIAIEKSAYDSDEYGSVVGEGELVIEVE